MWCEIAGSFVAVDPPAEWVECFTFQTEESLLTVFNCFKHVKLPIFKEEETLKTKCQACFFSSFELHDASKLKGGRKER